MVGIAELAEFVLTNPELGWIVVMGYLAYELRGKRGRIYKLDKKITSAIIVIRALSRADDKIDEEGVDEYLVENGMEPGDFINREENSGRPQTSGMDFARSDGGGKFELEDVISEDDEG